MAAITATFTITPLNPDGTDNTLLPAITSSSIPTTESIDWAAMGMNFKLVVECEITGTYPDSTSADLVATSIIYNPAFFTEKFSVFFPPGSIPIGGYIIQIPSGTATTYAVSLSGQGSNLNNNQNGSCEVEVIDANNFVITHTFRILSDVENYIVAKQLDNWTRLSKASNYSLEEGSIDRACAYGTERAINAVVAIRQRGNTTIVSPELSIPFSASFDGYQSNGDASEITFTYSIELVSDPGTEMDSLSPFEKNLITMSFEDPSGIITTDETSVIFVKRNLENNVSTFEKDFDLHEAKLITTGSTSQISGPIYGPVTYANSTGITTISFVIDGTELEKDINYQLHADVVYDRDVSDFAVQHVMTSLMRTDGSPQKVDFTVESEFWTRNGEHAEQFEAVAGERVTSVLTINRSEYDADAASPWTNFNDDIDTVSVKLYTADGLLTDTPFFSKFIQKDLTGNTFTNTDFISNDVTNDPSDSDEVHFWLKTWRIPFENFQGLDNWIGQTITFRWSITFKDQLNPSFGAVYYLDNELTIRDYEPSELSPSDDVVSNIQFLNPETGLPISNWCDLTSVLVTADIVDLGATTYVQVMVDKYPLGVLMYNDYALTESDPETHTLPAYVEIESLTSSLVSQLDSEPTDGAISFLLDISDLSDDEKMRIFIQAYKA